MEIQGNYINIDKDPSIVQKRWKTYKVKKMIKD